MRKIFLIAFLFSSGLAGAQTIPQKQIIDLTTDLAAKQKNLNWYDVTVYGADPTFTSDATSAIQSAINACVSAGGGVVYFPKGRYKIAGALYTSDNANSQLYIPLVAAPSGSTPSMISIKLLGEAPPAFFTEGVEGTGRNINGVILESTLLTGSGSVPSVLGTPWASAGVTGNRNYIKVEIENMIVRTATKSGGTDVVGELSGIDFFNLCAFNAKNLKVDVSSVVTEMEEPTNETYGIRWPYKNNKSELYNEGIVFIEGYKYGAQPGEHSTFTNLIVVCCTHGLYLNGPDQDYAVTINRLQVELCNYNITKNQTVDLTVLQYEGEHWTGVDDWWTFQKDINYITGAGTTVIFNSILGISFIGRSTNNSDFIGDAGSGYRVFNGIGENVNYGGVAGGTVPTEGLEAYWSLDDESGDFIDATGNGFDLTRNNGVTTTTGKVGGGAEFESASSQYLEGSASNTLSASTGLSVGGWFRNNTDIGQVVFMSKWATSGDNGEWLIYGSSNTFHFALSTDGTYNATYDIFDDTFDDGSWHFVVGTWNGSTMTLYVDGVSIDTQAIGTVKNDGTAPIQMGYDPFGSGVEADATMDELFVYNRALTAGEVTAMYNGGSGFSYGSSATYFLPTATASVLGGVKVGTGLSITDGVLSVTGGGDCEPFEIDTKTFDNTTGWTFSAGAGSTSTIASDGGTDKAHFVSVGSGNYASAQKLIDITGADILQIDLTGVNYVSGTTKLYLYDGASTIYYEATLNSDGDISLTDIDASGFPSTVYVWIGVPSGSVSAEIYIRSITVSSCVTRQEEAITITSSTTYTVAPNDVNIIYEGASGATMTLGVPTYNRVLYISNATGNTLNVSENLYITSASNTLSIAPDSNVKIVYSTAASKWYRVYQN